MGETARGYRVTLRHPVAGRLVVAHAGSVLGDYAGLGALLLLGYERSGRQVLGAAALFAVQAMPALVAGALTGGWLDQVPRRRALVGLNLAGAAVVGLPLFLPGLAPVLVTAALLGAIRTASVSVRSGVIAETVPEDRRASLLALLGTGDQVGQVVGYLAGSTTVLLVGAAPALLADAATFLLAGAVVAGVPFAVPSPRRGRPAVSVGLQEIRRQPVLRLLAPLVFVTASVTALPESLAAGVTGGADVWTPFVLAAGPAGQAAAMAVLGRGSAVERPSFQLVHLAWFALAFGVAALGRSPLWFVAGNLLVGSGVAWLLGPQTLFVRIAPPERMAQVTGTMIAGIITAEGIGTLLFGAVADATSVATAYRVAGTLVLAAALAGWVVKERTPEMLELDGRPDHPEH
ncbi:MAG TPA: MFS transporter [Nitriliruptorales bacterium]|nr:MFS transporter [Nitriliruptorales bacterium]